MIQKLLDLLIDAQITAHTRGGPIPTDQGTVWLPETFRMNVESLVGDLRVEMTPAARVKGVKVWGPFSADVEISKLSIDADGITAETRFGPQRIVEFGDVMGEQAYGASRDPAWDALSNEVIADHPWCAACGGTKFLQVHHIIPFHKDPSRELDRKNLIVLCMAPTLKCHWIQGHCGRSWSCWNEDVEQTSAQFLQIRQRAEEQLREAA